MQKRAAVILAAGQGTRMRSSTPKVLHAVGGRAMLDRAIDAAQALGCDPDFDMWTPEYGWWLEKREHTLGRK